MAILTESANATVGSGVTDVTGLTEENGLLTEPTGTDAADATNGTAATDATELTGPIKEGPLSTGPSKQVRLFILLRLWRVARRSDTGRESLICISQTRHYNRS